MPTKSADKKVPTKSADKKVKNNGKTVSMKGQIIEFLTANPSAKTAEISEVIGTGDRRTRVILKEMIEDGILETDGNLKNRVYMLKR